MAALHLRRGGDWSIRPKFMPQRTIHVALHQFPGKVRCTPARPFARRFHRLPIDAPTATRPAMSVPLPQQLAYPFAAPPAPGQAIGLAPGLRWIRMPLPFALDHINLWLLDEEDGATLVDCGYADAPTRAQWETQLATTLTATRCWRTAWVNAERITTCTS